MQLYQEILAAALAKEEVQITFPNLKINLTEIVESESYQALQKIKAVITDDSLTDSECLKKLSIYWKRWAAAEETAMISDRGAAISKIPTLAGGTVGHRFPAWQAVPRGCRFLQSARPTIPQSDRRALRWKGGARWQ